MYGMKQCPFVVEWIILTLQLLGNGSERLNHDILSDFIAFVRFLTIIASWSDDMLIGNIRLRVANQDNCKHIYILRVEGSKCRDLDLLVVAPSLTHITYWRFCRALLQEELLQAIKLPITSMRLGIIDSRYEITYSCSLDTALDDLPRGHEVAQGDDTEVVANGSTQQ